MSNKPQGFSQPPSNAKGVADAINLLNAIRDPKKAEELIAPLAEYIEKAEEYFEGFVELEKLGQYVQDETEKVVEQSRRVQQASQVLDARVREQNQKNEDERREIEEDQDKLQAAIKQVDEYKADVVKREENLQSNIDGLKTRLATVNSREAKLAEREREVEAKATRIAEAQKIFSGE